MKKSKLLFILLSVLGMVVTFAFINVDKKNSPTAKKPNIILILADDIGFETISAYGAQDRSNGQRRHQV